MSHRSKVLDISFFNHQRYSDKAIYILLKRTFYFFFNDCSIYSHSIPTHE